jgi:hypothetical protein
MGRTLTESRTLKRGIAGIFDAAIAGWTQERINNIAAAIKTGPNVVEIREDGTLIATVDGQIIFTSSEYECLALGVQLEEGDDDAAA